MTKALKALKSYIKNEHGHFLNGGKSDFKTHITLKIHSTITCIHL